jgi:hypothetical protein
MAGLTNGIVALLPHQIDTSPGQEIRLFGSHDRRRVSIWCDRTDDATGGLRRDL